MLRNRCFCPALFSACALSFAGLPAAPATVHAQLGARSMLAINGTAIQSLDTPVDTSRPLPRATHVQPDLREPTWWISTGPVSPSEEMLAMSDSEELHGAPPPRNAIDAPPPGYISVRVPYNVIELGVVSKGDGKTVWYRRALRFGPVIPARLSVRLGEISDIDRVYFNGVQIGGRGDWQSHAFQAYDRVRVYDIPPALVRPGRTNLLHVQVRGSFPDFLGIFRDRTALGPSDQIWKAFYYENMLPLLALSFYFAVGLYFLFLYLRRRREQENLFFGSFVLCLVAYQFLRTQLKYDLGVGFLGLKKTEYVLLQALVPLFFLFLRAYFPPETEQSRKIWRRFGFSLHAVVALVTLAIVVTPSPLTWWTLNKFATQPAWVLYLGSGAYVLAQAARRGAGDAWIMGATLAVLMFCLVVDTLTSRGVWNIPQLVPWGFIVFVVGFAVILANRFVRLNNETDRLNVELDGQAKSFHRFVPTQFLEILGKRDLMQVRLGDSALLRMSVLFSDLRSFTSLSESMSPPDNFKFMNSYLRRMEPAVKNHGGFVDKFIGDAVMALFPEPEQGRVRSAERAVAAAVEMRGGIAEYNRHRTTVGYAPIDIGIGINTGELMLGTVGSADRLDTTVIGDSVNMASRIEGLTPVYHVGILISDTTQAALPPERFLLREVDTIVVKGRTEPVIVYEVFDADEPGLRGRKLDSRRRLEGAMGLYKAQEFQAALSMFEALEQASPDDGLFAMYARRCRKLIVKPPGSSWKGAVRLRRK